MLGIDPDLTPMAPIARTAKRGKRIDNGPEERRLALAVVSHHHRAIAVFHFQVNRIGNHLLAVANCQVAATQGRPLTKVRFRDVKPHSFLCDFFGK